LFWRVLGGGKVIYWPFPIPREGKLLSKRIGEIFPPQQLHICENNGKTGNLYPQHALKNYFELIFFYSLA
jgi:hypothetical protein